MRKWMFLLYLSTQLYGQQVTLPLKNFEKLEKALPVAGQIAVTSSQLKLEVMKDHVRVVQQLNVNIDAEDWQKIPLPKDGAYQNVVFGDLEGDLVSDGSWYLQVKGKGRYQVQLESLQPLIKQSSRVIPTYELDFTPVSAASITGTITGTHFEKITSESSLLEEKGDSWHLIHQPGRVLYLTLYEKKPVAMNYEAQSFKVISASVGSLNRRSLSLKAQMVLQPMGGGLKEFEIELPKEWSFIDISSPLDFSWEKKDELLQVQLHQLFDEEIEIEISLRREHESIFEVPVLKVKGAKEHKFFVSMGIEIDGILSLKDKASGRLGRVDKAPDTFNSSGGYMLIVDDPEKLPVWEVEKVTKKRNQPNAQIDYLHGDYLVSREKRLVGRFWFEIRNTGYPSIPMDLPDGVTLLDVRRNGVLIEPGLDGNQIVLPLLADRKKQVISLSCIMPLTMDDKELRVELPAFQVPVNQLITRVLLPSGSIYTFDDPRQGKGHFDELRVDYTLEDFNNPLFETSDTCDEMAPFEKPPGYQEIWANWTSMAGVQKPLIIQMKAEQKKKGWL